MILQTVTIDILNANGLKLLQDLELLHVIRLRKNSISAANSANWALRYKGAMTKQKIEDIDRQIDELRNGWE